LQKLAEITDIHKNRAEMGYTCRMTEIIRLQTTKAVAVPKISSTVHDLYGQAILIISSGVRVPGILLGLLAP
jgi:uncharacterized protein with ACT and thioredoxin-like domain